MRNSTRLFFVLFLAVTALIFTSSGSAYFSTQNLRYNIKYECNGETILVGHCRSDDDGPGMARTQPSADYCMVYYPSRPKRGGFTVQEAELKSDVLRKLTACNALTAPESVSVPTTPGDESDAQTEYERGQKYYAAKDYERAATAFKRAIAIEPASGAYNDLGNSYRALDRNEEAAAAYKEAIRLKPDNPVAYNGLGISYFNLKRHELAVKAFREVLRLDPKFPDASRELAFSYFGLNRYEDAVTAFKDALRLKPNDALLLYDLGYALTFTSHPADALQIEQRLETVDKKKAQDLLEDINKSKRAAAPPSVLANAQTSPGLSHFSKRGLSFDYPADFTLEDQSWTGGQQLELTHAGTDAIIMVSSRYVMIDTAGQIARARRDVFDAFVDSMIKFFEDEQAKVERTQKQIVVAGKQASGVRLRTVTKIGPQNLDVYSLVLGRRLVMVSFIVTDKGLDAAASAWAIVRSSLKVH